MILVSIMLNAARRFLNPAQGERHDNCYDPTLITEPTSSSVLKFRGAVMFRIPGEDSNGQTRKNSNAEASIVMTSKGGE